MMGVGQELVRYAWSMRFEDLPEDVRHQGVRAFVNTVGCAAGGCREESVEIALQTGLEFASGDEAVLVGRPERMDVLNAAFVNAVSASVHSYNDTHFETVAHPASPVAAALLALAGRWSVSGRDFVLALVLGIELQCRIGRMLTVPPAESSLGLSMAGLVGGIGAAVATAKILRLDERQTLMAIGIAANQSAGLREAHATMSSHFTPGMASRNGIYAGLLAARGFTSSPTMLEGEKGFAVSFSSQPNFAAAVEELGSAFEIRKLAYKPYPCGFVIHPILDACLEIVRQHAPAADKIERIELRISPVAAALTNRPEPRDRRQALVSYQHWAAVSLLRGKAGLAEGDDAAVWETAVAELRGKVAAEVDASIGREAAHAAVWLRDGRVLEAVVRDCLGSERRPRTDDELDRKFRGQALMVWPEDHVDALAAWCWGVAVVADVGSEIGRLRSDRAAPAHAPPLAARAHSA